MALEPFRLRFGESEEGPADRIARSYQLRFRTIRRLVKLCQALGVYPSDLVDYLLTASLDRVDAGELVIETRPVYCRIVDLGDGAGG